MLKCSDNFAGWNTLNYQKFTNLYLSGYVDHSLIYFMRGSQRFNRESLSKDCNDTRNISIIFTQDSWMVSLNEVTLIAVNIGGLIHILHNRQPRKPTMVPIILRYHTLLSRFPIFQRPELFNLFHNYSERISKITYQTVRSSSRFTAAWVYFKILVTAEIAFSVGFTFSCSLASAAWMTCTKSGIAWEHHCENPGPPYWPITPHPYAAACLTC